MTSTLALEIIDGQDAELAAPGTQAAYGELLSLLNARQGQLEKALAGAGPLSPTAYTSLVATGLRASAVGEGTLQGQLAHRARPAAEQGRPAG